MPMLTVIRDHPRTLVLGTLASIETFVLFYLMTVFSLSWGTSVLGYSRNTFLLIQLVGVVFFALDDSDQRDDRRAGTPHAP